MGHGFNQFGLLGCLIACLWIVPAVGAEECLPSPWGKDDQIGAANRITPSRVVAAADLVQQGRTHPLGIVLEPGMPAFPPRYTSLQVVQPGQQYNNDLTPVYGWDLQYNDDVVQMWLGVGPQLDGLGHVGHKGLYYNCNPGAEISDITGLKRLGIENVPPLVARGVMIDMAGHFDVDSLDAGQPITSADLEAAMKAQAVELREGDVILIHTGWTDAHLKSDPQLWNSTIPGITNSAAEYLADFKPVAVGADTWGLGAVPPIEGDRVYHDHLTLIMKHGIYILETMNTGPLVDEGVSEFMFVLGQARLKGAVQMIINPVAMW